MNIDSAARLSPPEIVEPPARHTAVIHILTPRAEMPRVFGPAVQELVAGLIAQGMPPEGSAFAHHLRMPPGMFELEIGFTTAKPVAPAGRIKPAHWPAIKAAHTVYSGPYEGLHTAWAEFNKWVKAQGLAPAEDLWEHYVTGPQSSPDQNTWRTHLYRPLIS